MFGNVVYGGEVFSIKGFSFSKASGTMAIIQTNKGKVFIPCN